MKIIDWIKTHKLLVLIVLIGCLLRFYRLDFQSLWVDELFSINQSNPKNSLIDIYKYLRMYDPHPPLYYFSLHWFFQIFGYSTFILKMYSAIFGVAGIFGVYFLGKEIGNKKIALIATLITSVNYFHIFYSQEGRMYSLLFFTTTLSFTYLVKFIKQPKIKYMILNIVFSMLMIYTHFFALFAFVSQYLILLYFIYKPFLIERKKFLIYVIFSGIICVILYIPALLIFFENTKRSSIWIPMPEKDAFTQIFKEFFGFSEVLLYLIAILIGLFFIKLFTRDDNEEVVINPIKEKQVFAFLVIIIWILITILIPFVLSYINLPMIISRYFINILPALILLISFSIYYIKNRQIQAIIISFFVLFSLTDLIVVKRYYSAITKTQFRETSQFIIDKKIETDPVVTSLGMYFNYFLQNEYVNYKIIDKSLDDFVTELEADKSKLNSFWYADAHLRPFNPSEGTKLFLEENFVVDQNIDLFDAYAKHFILKSDYKPKKIDLTQYIPVTKSQNGDNIGYNIENFEVTQNEINFSGWAHLLDQGSLNSDLQIIAMEEDGVFYEILQLEKVKRDDVTTYFKSEFDLSNSGFKSTVKLKNLKAGKYKLGIYISDITTKKDGLIITDKFFLVE